MFSTNLFAQVDLVITNTTLNTTSVSPGGKISHSVTVKNQGTKTHYGSFIGYYLSSNSTLDEGDLYKGDSEVNYTMSEGMSVTEHETTTIPSDTPPGTYYLIFFADYQKANAESDESNNIVARKISVVVPSVPKPDLFVVSPYLAQNSGKEFYENSSYNINVQVVNDGPGDAPATKVKIYVSYDRNVSTDDHLAGIVDIPAISSYGQTAKINTTITTPYTSYGYNELMYILLKVDPDEGIDETNESNNVADTYLHNIIVENSGGKILFGSLNEKIGETVSPNEDILAVMHFNGTIVWSKGTNSEQFNMSRLKEGLYIFQFLDENKINSRKVYIQK